MEIIYHDTEPDFIGEKHEVLQYKHKDYIFNKEWYVNIEDKYVMELTLFKLGKKSELIPTIKYKGKYYNEILHIGHCIESPDDEVIEFAEMFMKLKGEK